MGPCEVCNGWTITGGQIWNLITLNRKGTDADNSNLWIPNIIEAQYSIGYDWGRFAEVRVSKTLARNSPSRSESPIRLISTPATMPQSQVGCERQRPFGEQRGEHLHHRAPVAPSTTPVTTAPIRRRTHQPGSGYGRQVGL